MVKNQLIRNAKLINLLILIMPYDFRKREDNLAVRILSFLSFYVCICFANTRNMAAQKLKLQSIFAYYIDENRKRIYTRRNNLLYNICSYFSQQII